MRSLLIGGLLMMLACRGSRQSAGFGRPLLWYSVSDPWGMFIGAEGPVFTVYQTGKVIYWRDKKYHLVELSAAELRDLLGKFRLTDTFFMRSKWVSASDATDQPSYDLMTDVDTLKGYSIYGNMRDRGSKERMPRQMTVVYDLVTSYTKARARDWLPDKIEVMLSDYENSPDQPIRWPAGWPDLSSPGSHRWDNGGGSLFLDNRYFLQLRRLLASRKEKQAFLISGKKYFVGYRLPMPGVDSVMAAHTHSR